MWVSWYTAPQRQAFRTATQRSTLSKEWQNYTAQRYVTYVEHSERNLYIKWQITYVIWERDPFVPRTWIWPFAQ